MEIKISFSKLIIFLVLIPYLSNAASDGFQPLVSPNKEYEYALPQRKVTSCPSFASFKFACQSNHLLSIESLVFSQVFVDEFGECVSDWTAECRDDSDALDYTIKECAGQESCSLYSYQLRSRTKCNFHQVISVFYKCVPTFEIVNVPVKCDICKNVTVNNIKENYGFIHSAWYPKLYPRVTCHSLIKNRPDHFIIIYSVSGSIGLDRIQIESVNQFGALVIRETLTGNLTTRLVVTSAFDVNITVYSADTYYYEQRRFLLYFYIVPKCSVILCSNITAYPYVTTTYPYVTTPSTTMNTTTFIHTTINSTINHSTYAPPLKADHHHHHSKISDAWLAAILALIYALLMVFAVLVAIYCRRRRRRRLIHENNIIFSPSTISSSQMINPISRVPSQISLKNEINFPVNSSSYLTSQSGKQSIDQHTIYSHVNRENYTLSHNIEEAGSTGFERVPQIRQTNYNSALNEFDNYSQVITEEDSFSGGNASAFMNYGDVDIKEGYHHQHAYNDSSYHGSVKPNSSIDHLNYHPYSMKTNTQHGSIIASAAGASHNTSDSMKSMYRAVEYTKSPIMERVRVKNLDESSTDVFDNFETTNKIEEVSSRAYTIDTRGQSIVTSENLSYRQDVNGVVTEDNEKTFVVKLFPLDEHQNEVQEMTMYVEK